MFAFPVCLRFLRIVDLLFSFCCFFSLQDLEDHGVYPKLTGFILGFRSVNDVLLGWVSEQKDSGASRNTRNR